MGTPSIHLPALTPHHRRHHHHRSVLSHPKTRLPPPSSASASIDAPLDPSAFRLFQPPPPPSTLTPSPLSPADPDLYRIGYARSFRAYGVHFLESPHGLSLHASRHVSPLRRARVALEIPLELMLTISRRPPWLFFPDLLPVPHPLFDLINSTIPDTDWDIRLACLLLFALDLDNSFWQLYSDFLPDPSQCTSLLLAAEDDLLQLQNTALAARLAAQRHRALEFWERNWHSLTPLKIRRLAPSPDRFLWAVAIAQTRAVRHRIRVGALTHDADMLVPYADMLNHSSRPNCFLHWRFKDRMLEVLINAGQEVHEGDEMTLNYSSSGARNDTLMERYGFSSATNPWDTLEFSGNSRIHLDSFLSVFDIAGLPEEYYHNGSMDGFVDGAVIAAARMLPSWSDGDVPPVPSAERRAAKELQEECLRMLDGFPTSWEEDREILEANPEASRTLEAAIRYRMNRKLLMKKVIQALEIYQNGILF